ADCRPVTADCSLAAAGSRRRPLPRTADRTDRTLQISDCRLQIGGERLQLLQSVAQTFDVQRAARVFVRLDNDGIEPGIARRGIEPCRKAVQKAAESRVDFNADDRVVRSG